MNVSQQSLLSSIESLLPGRVHAAEMTDEVMGVHPQVVVEPEHEDEVATLLAYANKEGLKVLVRGGGTQLHTGFPPTSGDIILSTTRLSKLVEHAPQDLTVTVQAGMPLVNLQNALAEARQWLALDPMLVPEATMGGIIATNSSGPRRLRYGGVRDQIIGVRVVLADGTIAKGGGKVVKNVAGYDLPKLFTGSLGTLGVIVEATFRLYPLPVTSRTVTITSPNLQSLCKLAVQAIGSTLVPTIIDIFGSTKTSDSYTMAVRFETGQESAEAQCTTFTAMANSSGIYEGIQAIQSDDEAQFWQRMNEQTPQEVSSSITVKASVLPTEVAGWLTQFQRVIQQSHLTAHWRVHAGHGLIFAHLAGEDALLTKAVDELRQAAMVKRGSLVVLDTSVALAQKLDVWGPSGAIDVMRRIKARFDPNGILNPGRFIGRI